jgi:hypothetical protein
VGNVERNISAIGGIDASITIDYASLTRS